jgi:outer membrane lipoprotein LolB
MPPSRHFRHFTRVCRGAGGLLAAVVCAVLLAACAALPAPPAATSAARAVPSAFALEGRFSLRHEERNYSGHLSWRHAGVNNEVLLSSPFGQGIAQVTTGDSGARLTTSDGRVFAAADAETLTQQVLGYPLPLAALSDWVRGRGAAAGSAELDAYGRTLRLRHDGWRIDYAYDGDDPQALPARLFAERAGGLELRLRIDEWNDDPPNDAPNDPPPAAAKP